MKKILLIGLLLTATVIIGCTESPECQTASDCPARDGSDVECNAGTCVYTPTPIPEPPECETDEDCPAECTGNGGSRSICSEGKCETTEMFVECLEECGAKCEINDDCEEGQTCNTETCECEEKQAEACVLSLCDCQCHKAPYQDDAPCGINCRGEYGIKGCELVDDECEELKEEESFCGSSTNASCQTNADCVAGGCSGQICQGKDEDMVTTCEWRDCYANEQYGLSCQCINNQCQWGEAQTGLEGNVTLMQGNCMPVVEENSTCNMTRVSRKVYIRELTTGDNTNTTLVKETESDEKGYYEVLLPPGEYSVFVEDNGTQYCTKRGSKGEACKVTIEEGNMTWYNIDINHAVW